MEYLSFESGEHYAKCLGEFKEKTGELVKNREILALCLPSVVRKVLQTNRDPQFNVLSVGSGDGVVDLEVLQIVQAELQRHDKYRDMKIFNRAIEPNRYHFSLYNKTIETLPDSLKGNTAFDVRAQTFGEYIQAESGSQENPATKFDLVHFNHSIYYVEPEPNLRHCLEKELKENGQVVVVVEGRDLITTISALKQVSATLEIGKPQESFVDEVTKVIHKNDWKYETFSQDYEIDVTEVFDEDSIQGNLLLDFLTFFVNFRATAAKAHIDKVLSVIRDHTIVRGGKRFGKKIDVALVISK